MSMVSAAPGSLAPRSRYWFIDELKRSWSVVRPAQAASGATACALGFTVVVGWLFRNDALMRVHPLFPPMPYSVAISLLICGVALLAGAAGWRRMAGASATVVLVLGLVTLAQYGLGVDWNLNRTLLGGLITGLPAGMTPASALSFVLVGVGIVAVSVNPQRGSLICAISGTTVAAQNGVAFVWYGFGLASYVVTGDAPHMAVGLAVAGIGTIAAAWERGLQSPTGPPRWLPVPVAFGIALVSLSLWSQSEFDRRAAAEQNIKVRAGRIGIDLNRRAGPMMNAFAHLATVEAAGIRGQAEIEPRTLSALVLEQFPAVFAIAFVDRQSGFHWIQARSPVTPSLSDIQAVENACGILLRVSRPSPTVVDQRDLASGASGFAIGFPVIDRNRVVGFVVGLFRYEQFFFTTIAEDVGAEYWLRVFDGHRELYRPNGGVPSDEGFQASAAIPFLGATWRAELSPRSVQNQLNPLGNTTLVFSLLFAGLLGWTVQSAQRSARSRDQLSHAKADLESAIAARQAEQMAHAASEVRFRQIVDAAADVIYRTDAQGRFIFVNPAAIRVTKWSRDALIGRSYLSLIRPDYQSSAQEFYKKQLEERIPSTYLDFPMLTADGQEVWIGQHVQLLTEGERVIGFQAVARDISQPVRMQQDAQRMRDAALETARLKSEFVANTSHEIRTPLNGIIGFSNLLGDSELTKEQSSYVEGLRLSADALLAVVDDILDFSKLEAGMLRVDTVSFDPRVTIEHSTIVFAETAKKKGVVLHVQVHENLPRRAKGDPNRLRQVLTNLLANAIKFTDRGSITVSAETAVQTEGHVIARFCVRDTGIGIEAEAVTRLFQPFVQADGSTNRRYGGTGLGLAISRQLVELMGGSIEVDTVVGAGSAFSFTAKFEREDAENVPGVGDAAEPSDRHKRPAPVPRHALPEPATSRILVTDDNPISQQVTKLLIEKLGHVVETASDGIEAARAAAHENYALILMDCQMPLMDGYTATAEIRRVEGGQRRTPIIAFTASSGLQQRQRCLESGMDDLLEKPVRKDELVEMLDRWLSPRAANRESGPGKSTGRRDEPLASVDDTVLTALEVHIGPETLNQMISLYLDEFEKSLRRFEHGVANERVADLVAEAHRLKGSATTLGFVRTGGLCEALEAMAETSTPAERLRLVEDLREAYSDLCVWQRTRLLSVGGRGDDAASSTVR